MNPLYMTKRELIERLSKFPGDMPVVVCGCNFDMLGFNHYQFPSPTVEKLQEREMDGGHVGSYDIITLERLSKKEHEISQGESFEAIVLRPNPFHQVKAMRRLAEKEKE